MPRWGRYDVKKIHCSEAEVLDADMRDMSFGWIFGFIHTSPGCVIYHVVICCTVIVSIIPSKPEDYMSSF